MHRVAASLKDGTVTSVLLAEKLQALTRKNLVHRGLEEYGRLLRTIDILTFISDPPYRHRIGRMLTRERQYTASRATSPTGSTGYWRTTISPAS